ncbi:putative NOT transcription complex subunit VIP2 [Porphyridium purpureum]|uniref:Putative NOT transcription complex subunit VIP2 n=1 Tax=Porphyridium purpureum TaxID=35688 RepID=A0A5J4Z5T6_PORPP|nr:putative NOT transcription complex subunit VIP2 [Porphyridium purpureum]|eukprot:POR4803..scf295_1
MNNGTNSVWSAGGTGSGPAHGMGTSSAFADVAAARSAGQMHVPAGVMSMDGMMGGTPPPQQHQQRMSPSRMGGMSMPSQGMSGQNGVTLDMREFPSLGAPASHSSPVASANGSSSAAFAGPGSGMGPPGAFGAYNAHFYRDTRPPVTSSPEFTVSNEDFPALGGSRKAVSAPSKESTMSSAPGDEYHNASLYHNGHENASAMQSSLGGYAVSSSASAQKSGTANSQESSAFSSAATSGGSGMGASAPRTGPAGSAGAIGTSPEKAREEFFGIRGLLRTMNPGPENAKLLLLSVGLDLTRLGLNLNSADPLYASMESVFSENAAGQDTEPDFRIPECYRVSPPPLKGVHFARFNVETLFYIFYSMPRDALQVYAALELYNRHWQYHRELKLWFAQVPGTQMGGFESQGAYIYFDVNSWERRPFRDANRTFLEGFLTEDEIRSFR